MPNHVLNKVSLKGETTKINELIEFMGEQMDFNKVLPMPKELEGTHAPSIEPNKELISKYGADNWYDWRIENWGTKWNAYYGLRNNKKQLDNQVYTFYTAWDTPRKALTALAKKFPSVILHVEFADEDYGYNCGFYTLQADKVLDSYTPDYDKKFALDLWGLVDES